MVGAVISTSSSAATSRFMVSMTAGREADTKNPGCATADSLRSAAHSLWSPVRHEIPRLLCRRDIQPSREFPHGICPWSAQKCGSQPEKPRRYRHWGRPPVIGRCASCPPQSACGAALHRISYPTTIFDLRESSVYDQPVTTGSAASAAQEERSPSVGRTARFQHARYAQCTHQSEILEYRALKA